MDMDLDKLIKPYIQGGTEFSPQKRSLETIINKLVLKNKISPEIAGAAILKVFSMMANEGLEFKGDGSYGSKGKEFYKCIKDHAIKMATQKAKDDVVLEIYKNLQCTALDCTKRKSTIDPLTRRNRLTRFLNKPRGFWKP